VPEEPANFEWDPANLRYLARHRVTPAEAEEVMENDPTDLGYDVVEGEPRWTVAGHTNLIRVLVFTWTFREEKVRIVTAWQAPKKLRADYFKFKRYL
jgi:uncharacterized DUF497 family protein